jgi:eukaryotic-like serine/threonine-protein kinase
MATSRGDSQRQAVMASVKPSAARLLAQSTPKAEGSPPEPSPLAVISAGALAPTVVEWMPVSRASDPDPLSHEREKERVPPMSDPMSAPPSSLASDATIESDPCPESPRSGVSAREPDPLASVGLHQGALVDRTYRVERALGIGGMGVVALAIDERLDRRVAIKFIKAELFAFPEMRTFFHNEARAMARVSHPNVLQVYAFGDHNGTPYFVMEYVEGRTVEHWLRNRPAGMFPDLEVAVRILDQACLGVEAIHGVSTVHRDIKPSNLLIDETFRVAVGDLGVARILEAATTTSFIVGSAAYMAPESALGEDEAAELAHRRDIYALGCLAYELFTGRAPFTGNSDLNVLSQHVLQEAPPPSTVRPDLDPAFDAIIMRALAKDPNHRWPTVAAFRRALIAEHNGTREPERILVADDDPDWRTIIVSALSQRFPSSIIDEVNDGEAALEAFDKNPYSVVLVDLEMPAMDGAKLTLLLRANEANQRTPIIVLTAAGGPREWQRLSAIGADAFLVKPVDADDVELVIRRTIRSRRTVPPSSRMSSAPTST